LGFFFSLSYFALLASKQIIRGGHWIEEEKYVKQNKINITKVGTKGKKQGKFHV